MIDLYPCTNYIGYKTKGIPFIPISRYKGDNLKIKSENMSWWNGFDVRIKKETISGVTLCDAFEKVVHPPTRLCGQKLPENKLNTLLYGYIAGHADRKFIDSIPVEIMEFIISMMNLYHPFRMSVSGVYKIKGVGDVITGRIEQGTINQGAKVKFHPTHSPRHGCSGTVFSIEMHHKSVEEASHGDNVGINVKGLSRENMPRVGDIMVIDDIDLDPDPPLSVESFTALVFVQDHPGKLMAGTYTPSIHVRTAKAPCKMSEIIWKMGKSTKYEKMEGASYVEAGDQAMVVFQPKMPLVVTTFDDCEPLGRIAVMDCNSLIMLGKVVSIKQLEWRYRY